MPVRMRNGASCSFSTGHVGELLAQALGAEAVGDREPRRVVGEHHVLVAERDRRAGHRLDGGAAVAPAAVQVQVAAQRVAVHARRRRVIGTWVLASRSAR